MKAVAPLLGLAKSIYYLFISSAVTKVGRLFVHQISAAALIRERRLYEQPRFIDHSRKLHFCLEKKEEMKDLFCHFNLDFIGPFVSNRRNTLRHGKNWKFSLYFP